MAGVFEEEGIRPGAFVVEVLGPQD